MIDLEEEIKLYKSKVAFYESQNTRGEYAVTVRELKFVVETLEALRSERTTGDCISREDLKKAIEPYRYAICGFEGILAIIDSALTVEITEEQAINKLHETGWLIGHDKEMTTRPQGTWKLVARDNQDIDVECPFCHKQITGGDLNFCVKCGADMRGDKK